MDAMNEMLGEGATGAIGRLFRMMEIAEEEIEKNKKRIPEKWKKDIFLLLQPTPFLYLENGLCPEQVYRGHCRELIERTIKGEDVNHPTYAEVLIQYSHASLRAPLNHHHAEVMRICFEYCYRGETGATMGVIMKDKLFTHNGAMLHDYQMSFDTARREIFNRRKKRLIRLED